MPKNQEAGREGKVSKVTSPERSKRLKSKLTHGLRCPPNTTRAISHTPTSLS